MLSAETRCFGRRKEMKMVGKTDAERSVCHTLDLALESHFLLGTEANGNGSRVEK
jgi:hypothetical protein